MENLPNIIVIDVADFQKSEIQTINRKIKETRNEKKMLKRKNKTLKLVNQQLITQQD